MHLELRFDFAPNSTDSFQLELLEKMFRKMKLKPSLERMKAAKGSREPGLVTAVVIPDAGSAALRAVISVCSFGLTTVSPYRLTICRGKIKEVITSENNLESEEVARRLLAGSRARAVSIIVSRESASGNKRGSKSRGGRQKSKEKPQGSGLFFNGT